MAVGELDDVPTGQFQVLQLIDGKREPLSKGRSKPWARPRQIDIGMIPDVTSLPRKV